MKSIIVILFTFILTFSNSLHAACNSASVLGDNLPASEGECIQRITESCVWAPDSNAASGFSCQVCDTNVPAADGKSIAECFNAYSGDLISAIVCAAKNSEKLSLDNFCYNSMHGMWQEGSFIGEDVPPANGSDIDSNDVQISGIFSEVKLSTLAASDSLLISEIAVLSAGIPGGSDSVDAMIYNPAGVTSINGNAVNTTQRVSPVVLISDFNNLGLGFSTINVNQQTSQEVLSSLTPSLAYNYSYISSATAADLEFFVDNGVPQNDELLMSDDNLFSRMGIKNKTLGLDTYFDSTAPKFLGLPKEIILEEKRVYTNSLGLASSASTVDIQNRVLEIKTKLSDLKSASVSASVDLKKQEIKNLSSGIILNIKESNGLYDQKSFSVISPPKFVDGVDTNIRGSSSKSLDDYLESLLNGNIQNSLELISRKDLNEYYKDLAGDSGVSLDSLFGASCANDDDCGGQEKCRKNICTCKNIECSGKSASIYKIDLNLDSDDLVVSQTTTGNNNLNNFSGVKTQSDITVLPGSYFKTMNQSLGGITSKVKRNKQLASNSTILNYLLPVDVYANAVTCNNQDTSKSCRTEGNTFYDSDGCPMSRNGDGFATALGACLISYNSKNPETIRGVMFLGEAAECLAEEEGLLLNPGTKRVLVDFSDQRHLNCFGGIKDGDMPDFFYLDLTVNSLASGNYDYEIIYDPSDDYVTPPNTSSSDATKFYIGMDSTSSQVISVLALEESQVADYVAMAQFNQGSGVLSFELIDKGVTGQIGRRSRAVVKGTVQSSVSTSTITFDSSLPIYYSGWQIEYAGQNSDHWYTFTSFENDTTSGKENLVREYFYSRFNQASSGTNYETKTQFKKEGSCFDRNINGLATTSNFCSPLKIGIKAWNMLLKNLVGENLILDFSEIKNSKPSASFDDVTISNSPIEQSTPITGSFCSGMGGLLTLNSSGAHSFSTWDWSGLDKELQGVSSGGNYSNSIKVTATFRSINGMLQELQESDVILNINLNRNKTEGILHIIFDGGAGPPKFVSEYIYAGSCETYDLNGSSSNPQLITSNILDLNSVSSISKLRSFEGHDEPDAFESCVNLKHYFCMDTSQTQSEVLNKRVVINSVDLKSPFDGKIIKMNSDFNLNNDISDYFDTENLQFAIQSQVNKAFTFQFAHLRNHSFYDVGDNVSSGEILGTAFVDGAMGTGSGDYYTVTDSATGVQSDVNIISPYEYTDIVHNVLEISSNSCIDAYFQVNDSYSVTGGHDQYKLLSMFDFMISSVSQEFNTRWSDFNISNMTISESEMNNFKTILSSEYSGDKSRENYFCHIREAEADATQVDIPYKDSSGVLQGSYNIPSEGIYLLDHDEGYVVPPYFLDEREFFEEKEKGLSSCFMTFPAPDLNKPNTYIEYKKDEDGNYILDSEGNEIIDEIHDHSRDFPDWYSPTGTGCCTGNVDSQGFCVY